MTLFISILRGINVSGQKKIKMADLKALYQGLGYSDVATYIQSGNVIFSCDGESANIKLQIEQAISTAYDFDVPVLVIKANDFKSMVEQMPFAGVELESDGTKVMFTFLAALANQENNDKLMTYVKAPEELQLLGQVAYVHCPNGYGKSKLSNVFIENKLKVAATSRNWKTAVKLVELTQVK
jgi:uncharacterized protein (DUF1697 family)